MGYQSWHHQSNHDEMIAHLQRAAKSWIEPRHLFDKAIEYMSLQRIAIRKYTTLRILVSQAMTIERNGISTLLAESLSVDLAAALSSFLGNDGTLPLRKLRQTAKSFAPAELAKELVVNHQVQPRINEIDVVVGKRSLSLKNRQHVASMVDFYGSKIVRFDQISHCLFMLCYLLERANKTREYLVDGFVYHAKKHGKMRSSTPKKLGIATGKMRPPTLARQLSYSTFLWTIQSMKPSRFQ